MTKAPSYIALARQILMQEATGLQTVAETLDQRFDAAVEMLVALDPRGRVVVCGIGKTGMIGAKISATLASVGFPSYVLHPAEAVHGDLGRLTAHDIVLLLSNSGQTSEVLQILPYLKRITCQTIAITAGTDSPLARQASVHLPLPKLEEAGPLGLAPTTSTTALLALGDALTMSAAQSRQISRELFAQRHPGGMLGKTLMLVGEVMRSGEQMCIVPQEMLCREALHQITLTKGRPGCAAIVDRSGTLVGIFTDGDLRRCLDKTPNFLEHPVSTVMSKTPKTVVADSLAEHALRVMNEFQIDQVIVTDASKKPIGLLDIQDLVQVG